MIKEVDIAKTSWIHLKNHSFLIFTLVFLVMLKLSIPKTSDLAFETKTRELCDSVNTAKTEYAQLNAELRCASAIGALYAIKTLLPIVTPLIGASE